LCWFLHVRETQFNFGGKKSKVDLLTSDHNYTNKLCFCKKHNWKSVLKKGGPNEKKKKRVFFIHMPRHKFSEQQEETTNMFQDSKSFFFLEDLVSKKK
jgi:hypothetical protein